MLHKILQINKFSTKTIPSVQATEYLLKQLKDKSDIAVTKDNHQIYAGVMIRRDPIFMRYLDWELEYQQFQYTISKTGLL